MKNYDLAIASDHAGVKLKGKIIQYLQKKGMKVLNLGTDTEERVDYPDFTYKMVEEIIEQTVLQGILICGTGIGMSIAANRSSDIRAALCTSEFMAERARSHNDANILVLGSKLVDDDISIKIVEKFLQTEFEGGRHARRIAKIK
ncbi:MAG: ribose 5-phosphate isomerase B [Rickettsiaceae bacterium]|nr:ribose 5-phosphate isomerase B [Rickettsiaceae bacterium]